MKKSSIELTRYSICSPHSIIQPQVAGWFQFYSSFTLFCFAPQKKIAGAFSFTKKSKRKQEYKELALKHGYGSGKFPNEQHEQKLLTEDVSEHDWQLL